MNGIGSRMMVAPTARHDRASRRRQHGWLSPLGDTCIAPHGQQHVGDVGRDSFDEGTTRDEGLPRWIRRRSLTWSIEASRETGRPGDPTARRLLREGSVDQATGHEPGCSSCRTPNQPVLRARFARLPDVRSRTPALGPGPVPGWARLTSGYRSGWSKESTARSMSSVGQFR